MDEIPRAVLLRHQAALEAVLELGHRALQMRHLLVEIGAQPRQLVGVAQLGRSDDLVMLFGEADIIEIRNVGRQAVGADRQHPLVAFAAHFGFAVGLHFLCVGVGVAIVGLVAVHLGARVDLAFAAAAILAVLLFLALFGLGLILLAAVLGAFLQRLVAVDPVAVLEREARGLRSEEHTSELQSLMRSSYAVFCLKKKNI